MVPSWCGYLEAMPVVISVCRAFGAYRRALNNEIILIDGAWPRPLYAPSYRDSWWYMRKKAEAVGSASDENTCRRIFEVECTEYTLSMTECPMMWFESCDVEGIG